ncbi:GntR family transcriptional regulator [Kribbella capetownensis]|uniref:GntR family transcriptional regulator n=1 Tax=Kribbella capetownensis TaxID=1572659 RepID=UPI00192DBE5A|nr:GntR family transcriptional regulator [Kribbella capetownensis]
MTVGEPAVERVRKRILEGVVSGRYPSGSRLPSERQFAIETGLSRMTVRAGFQAASDEGLIVPSPQRGWYVRDLVLREPPSRLQSFTEMAHELGFRPSSDILDHRERPATLDEAHRLHLAPTAPVVAIRRLRGMDGRPVTVEDLVIPVAIAPWLPTADLTNASLYELFSTHGIEFSYSRYTVQAQNADATLATLLNLPTGGAILVATEIAFAQDTTTPLLSGTNHYRGDAYQFTADLTR